MSEDVVRGTSNSVALCLEPALSTWRLGGLVGGGSLGYEMSILVKANAVRVGGGSKRFQPRKLGPWLAVAGFATSYVIHHITSPIPLKCKRQRFGLEGGVPPCPAMHHTAPQGVGQVRQPPAMVRSCLVNKIQFIAELCLPFHGCRSFVLWIYQSLCFLVLMTNCNCCS